VGSWYHTRVVGTDYCTDLNNGEEWRKMDFSYVLMVRNLEIVLISYSRIATYRIQYGWKAVDLTNEFIKLNMPDRKMLPALVISL
jgi:hypothetical protein